MGERALCGLCPKNNEAAFERGHKATLLSKLAWPLVQVSLVLHIVSFSSSNWCDGQAVTNGVNGRIHAGAWRTCLSTAVNTTLHPDALPIAICSDTASYIVDGLKTGWVAAWRAFLILSFLLLLLTSALVSIYMFGGRSLKHSAFPLFFAFASGFASSMFGALSLLVFYVQAGKAPELQGVPSGWAAGVNIAAVVTISYTIFLILGEFMEITDFRAKRKQWRLKQHATLSDYVTSPPPEGSGSCESSAPTGNSNGNEAPAAVTTRQVSQDATGYEQQPSSVVHVAEQRQVPSSPSAQAMLQASSTRAEDPAGTASASPTASPPPLTASAQDAQKNGDRDTSTMLPPPMSSKASIDWSGNNQKSTQSLAEAEEEEDRFRIRKVTLRKYRRSSHVDPDDQPS